MTVELKPCPFCGGKAHDLPGGSPPEVIHKNLSCPADGVHDRDAWNRRAEPGWVRVEDRLPEMRGIVLIRDYNGGISSALRAEVTDNRTAWAWWTHDGTYLHPTTAGVTHWMPLPAPPADRPGEG